MRIPTLQHKIGKSNTAGVVVLYFPDKNVLDNIKSYADCIDKILIIDNTDNVNYEYPFQVNQLPENSFYIKNNENLGIALALNLAAKQMIKEGYRWILTMDQDSFIAKTSVEILFKVINNYPNVENIGIVAPFNIITDKKYSNNEYCEVLSVITSGNIVNLNNLKSIGFYNEDLFIDYVDHDIGIRFNLSNYKVIICFSANFDHTLGEFQSIHKKKNILNTSNHSSIRRYYITRNRFYLINKYKMQLPEFYKKEIIAFVKETLKIILLENDKVVKIKMTILGIKHFNQSIFGKLI